MWKIADFGFTQENGTQHGMTTENGRGTGGFRAPEILHPHGSVNKNSDIWAFGCILYQLVSGNKAFANDDDTWDCMTSKKMPYLSSSDTEALSGFFKSYILQLIDAMFAIEWWKRPEARDILKVLNMLADNKIRVYKLPDNESISFDMPKVLPLNNEISILVQWLQCWYDTPLISN